jgi:hypothetical protein
MEAKVYWLFVFVALYWAYCVFWGIKSAMTAKTASDYFIAGRRLSIWVFILAATATSFSGWTFMGHPGLVYRDGFQYAYASFYTVTIPFTGVIKRFGYVTPGEMLADYFQGDAIRILVVMVALLFSIPYLGVQLGASGFLFNVLTDGLISVNVGMWVLSLVVLIYVASGGLRAVAYVDTVQCILLGLGIVITGLIALNIAGGWDALNAGFAELGKSDIGKWGTTQGYGGGDYNAYFAIPGVIQFTAGLGKETPVGGLWTVGPGVHHVGLRQPEPEALRAAAGLGLVVLHRVHPVLLHRLPGHGRASAGRQSRGDRSRAGDLDRPGRSSDIGQAGLAGAVLLQRDRGYHAVARRHPGGLRPGGHAVDRCGLHVHRRRHADPRPL